MGMRNTASYTGTALDAANEYMDFVLCTDYQYATLTFAAAAATATIKVYVSASETKPTLASAASAANPYTTIWFRSAVDETLVVWWTGISRTGATTDVQQITVKLPSFRWIGVVMTARSAWAVTPRIDLFNNA